MIGVNSSPPLPIDYLYNFAKELFIHSGYVYFPLLFDPDVEKELKASGLCSRQHVEIENSSSNILLRDRESWFVKGMSLESFVSSYEKLAPESYNQHLEALYKELPFLSSIDDNPITDKLCTIILEILPYFVSKNRRHERKKLTRDEVLELVSEKLNIPPVLPEHARRILNIEKLRVALNSLSKARPTCSKLPSGIVSKTEFEHWFSESLKAEIIKNERRKIKRSIASREKFARINEKVLAVLFFAAEKGSLEIEGFGFFATEHEGEFIIYKRTGEYALKDYYGRIYMFPDCRVAIRTNGTLDPFVIENYKHPFLQKHAPGQKICMRNTLLPSTFTAQNAIFAIQEGISALLYGYKYRKRNGYHSLDSIPMPGSTVTFDDYMVPKDHPRILRGEVLVTNEFR